MAETLALPDIDPEQVFDAIGDITVNESDLFVRRAVPPDPGPGTPPEPGPSPGPDKPDSEPTDD